MEQTLFSLGTRLETCASFVRKGKIPADIGTDHAYLPIWLVANHIVPMAFASDINEKPIRLAEKNIERFGYTDKVKTFTANGLEKIPSDKVDDIIIAGMGGDNIAAILSGVNWLSDPRYRLILQPMTRASVLRKYLFENGFEILQEKALCESKKLYTVICAQYSTKHHSYSDFDIYAGKLDSTDEKAASLLLKQAAILRSAAEGSATSGNLEQSKKYEALANELEDYVGRK